MLKTSIIELLDRDLNKLKQEINAYPDESKMWIIDKEIKNSAGNLCLHIVGNLQHFIGAVLGNTGYVRTRDSEFSAANIPRSELLGSIDKTLEVIKNVIDELTEEKLSETYPIDVFKKKMSTTFFLIHLISHLNYHLGQINYHRRLLTG